MIARARYWSWLLLLDLLSDCGLFGTRLYLWAVGRCSDCYWSAVDRGEL